MKPLSEISRLKLETDGLWRPGTRSKKKVSYPVHGNASCVAAEETSYWFQHRNLMIVLAMAEAEVRTEWLLDVGGGNGAVALFLQKAGFNVALLEPGEVGARNALARGVKTVVNSTIEDAGFAAGSVPVVGLFDVLEHFEDDVGLLKLIEKSLRDDGAVVIAVPAYSFLWSKADDDAGHFRRYTEGELKDALALAGLRIAYSTYFFAPLVLPIFFLRSLRSKFGGSVKASQSVQADHGGGGGVAVVALRFLLRVESLFARFLGAVPFGASLLVVARKRGRQ